MDGIKTYGEAETSRRRYVLNITIALSIILATGALLIRLYYFVVQKYRGGISLTASFLICFIFMGAAYLSWRGHWKKASYLVIFSYFSISLCFVSLWGIDLPANLLLQGLCIILSGILFGSRAIIYASLTVLLEITVFAHLQTTGIFQPISHWREKEMIFGDVIGYALIFSIISFLSWMSSKHGEKYLAKANEYERTLKEERDSFEDKVKERTLELKVAQAEKISQLYRFSEFGKLSSGLFHDLMNPLTAVSLSLESLGGKASDSEGSLSRALSASKKMEGIMASIRKQIRQEAKEEWFYPAKEIIEIASLFDYRFRKEGDRLRFRLDQQLETFGNPLQFGQIVLNLIANACDACQGQSGSKIRIMLKKSGHYGWLEVSDDGPGIPEGLSEKIFEPFFSTKQEKGLGIGLASSRNLARKRFRGDLTAHNRHSGGARFIFKFPLDGPSR